MPICAQIEKINALIVEDEATIAALEAKLFSHEVESPELHSQTSRTNLHSFKRGLEGLRVKHDSLQDLQRGQEHANAPK